MTRKPSKAHRAVLPWCVQHRDGWCAVKTGMRPAEAAASVQTKCGHFVVLPMGAEQTDPDCPDCIAALKKD